MDEVSEELHQCLVSEPRIIAIDQQWTPCLLDAAGQSATVSYGRVSLWIAINQMEGNQLFQTWQHLGTPSQARLIESGDGEAETAREL